MHAIDWRPETKKLRQFGVLALVAFGALGLFIFWTGSLFGLELGAAARPTAFTLWAVGLLSGAFSLFLPAANRFLYVGLAVITFPIGLVVSHVLMALFFYGLLTPVGLVFRLLGRDPLRRRFEPQRTSYWEPHRKRDSKESYFKQF